MVLNGLGLPTFISNDGLMDFATDMAGSTHYNKVKWAWATWRTRMVSPKPALPAAMRNALCIRKQPLCGICPQAGISASRFGPEVPKDFAD
jgi:hypothetical protein